MEQLSFWFWLVSKVLRPHARNWFLNWKLFAQAICDNLHVRISRCHPAQSIDDAFRLQLGGLCRSSMIGWDVDLDPAEPICGPTDGKNAMRHNDAMVISAISLVCTVRQFCSFALSGVCHQGGRPGRSTWRWRPGAELVHGHQASTFDNPGNRFLKTNLRLLGWYGKGRNTRQERNASQRFNLHERTQPTKYSTPLACRATLLERVLRNDVDARFDRPPTIKRRSTNTASMFNARYCTAIYEAHVDYFTVYRRLL